ncbi:MAG TPA: hypothetical protein VI248_17960 [Kineosporiaceae bacterium]
MSLTVMLRRVTAPGVLTDPVKVPEVTLAFWIVKVLTTGTGEALSDYLASSKLIVAAGVGLLGLVVGLALQLWASRYVPWIYWFTVTMVAVFGTMAADAVHQVLGIPYPVTSALYALTVAGALAVWWWSERTLDIHSITAGRRESFYWVTVVATFALGTAVGDLSAFTLGLGFLPSAVLYAVLIALPAVGWRLGLNPVLAFWGAYVLTRPLGASIADWLGKPADYSGVGLGDGPVAVLGLLAISGAVAYLHLRPRASSDHARQT